MPNQCPYVECQARQRFVTNLDDTDALDDELVNMEYAVWGTRIAVHRFMSCLARGKIQKTPMPGMDSVFEMCASRVFRFFIAMNHYNRENWYTSLRPSEALARNMYPGDLEAPVVYEISGKTILYMFKSIDETSIGRRVSPLYKQINLESGLIRDCIETHAREALFVEINNRYGIAPEQFSRPERCNITHPKSGPLAKILAHCRQSGYTARVGDFHIFVEDLSMTQLYLDAVRVVIANPLHFGISESVILYPTFFRRRVARLEDLAREGRPLTNEFQPQPDTPPVTEMRMDALQRSITTYSAKEDMTERSFVGPLLLRVPAPFHIVTANLSLDMEYPITIKYDKINRNNTVRQAITMAKRKFTVTPIDIQTLRKPDITLAFFEGKWTTRSS